MSGKLTLISSATASGASSVEFTSGIDSTYDEYVFYFVDINPATDDRHFSFQASTDSGSTYATTLTTTYFWAYHKEDDSATSLGYNTSRDLAQSTDFQNLCHSVGSGSDESCVGGLHLFSPSSTSKVKHFYSRSIACDANNQADDVYVAGYFNTTSALDAIKFMFTGGSTNFDGNIYLFGVS